MDQFSAHLDRGWDLVQRGDSHGAEQSARRALELDSQSPEAYNLLGYVGALQGDFEDAVEYYRQAIALDDGYLEAMLNAAEVYIHPLGEFEEALSLCDQALDLAQNDDEVVDALLLKFDALLGLNEIDRAKELCARFPEGPFENPNHTFLVGRALYEVGEVERAAPLVEQAVKDSPKNPEAFYYLGLVRDERGDTGGATQAFLRSRELDLELPTPSWSLTAETFAHSVRQAVAALDSKLRAFVDEDHIYVSDVPGVEVVVDGVDPRALLLLDAVAGPDGLPADQARLFVYQRNLERLAGALEHIESELTAALDREITALFIERQDPTHRCVD
ncbi:MAG: tetratricopeptide repeat protein [Polyangiaceae bacterium]|nr:tetratricopeptide repeat protein [Polyangiaceae bacterium]MCB9608441.1 tetratricopeptide repeat protein [Polyangiaceae bacterium]